MKGAAGELADMVQVGGVVGSIKSWQPQSRGLKAERPRQYVRIPTHGTTQPSQLKQGHETTSNLELAGDFIKRPSSRRAISAERCVLIVGCSDCGKRRNANIPLSFKPHARRARGSPAECPCSAARSSRSTRPPGSAGCGAPRVGPWPPAGSSGRRC